MHKLVIGRALVLSDARATRSACPVIFSTASLDSLAFYVHSSRKMMHTDAGECVLGFNISAVKLIS